MEYEVNTKSYLHRTSGTLSAISTSEELYFDRVLIKPQNPTWRNPIMNQHQPLSIRLMYGSALAVQGFDAFAFLFISPIVIPKRAELAHPLTRFWMRVTGVSFLPYVLSCWLLRNHHIRHTQVGFIVGTCFALYNAGLAALYTWSALKVDEYTIRPFWYAAGWRVVWASWSLWGLLAAP